MRGRLPGHSCGVGGNLVERRGVLRPLDELVVNKCTAPIVLVKARPPVYTCSAGGCVPDERRLGRRTTSTTDRGKERGTRRRASSWCCISSGTRNLDAELKVIMYSPHSSRLFVLETAVSETHIAIQCPVFRSLHRPTLSRSTTGRRRSHVLRPPKVAVTSRLLIRLPEQSRLVAKAFSVIVKRAFRTNAG